MHWSLGGPAPAGPGCSYSLNGSQEATSPDPSAQLLHVALQTELTGYVAVSWTTSGGMFPADGVIGFLSGSVPSVGAYKILGKTASSVQEDAGIVLTNTGVEANATALTICFTRNISQIGQGANIAIEPARAMLMNFVAASGPFPSMHKHGHDYQCGGKELMLLRAPGAPDQGDWRPSNTTSDTSVADAIEAERLGYMRAHGALQFTGWIVLVPLGILAARHRWLFTRSGVVGLWFQVHRAVQMVAIILVVTGFILPWTTFNSNDAQAAQGMSHEAHMHDDDTLLESHETLAILLMAALGVHVVVAVARPKPEASWRWAWNLVHWWTGRSLALLAGVNVTIGIALWRRVSGGSGAEWVVPLVLFAMGWIGLAFWLERRAVAERARDGAIGVATLGGPGGKLGNMDHIPLNNGLPPSSPSDPGSPNGDLPLTRLTGVLSGNSIPYNKL